MNVQAKNQLEFEAKCELAYNLISLENEIESKYENIKKSIIWGFCPQRYKAEYLAELDIKKQEEKFKRTELLIKLTLAKYHGFGTGTSPPKQQALPEEKETGSNFIWSLMIRVMEFLEGCFLTALSYNL